MKRREILKSSLWIGAVGTAGLVGCSGKAMANNPNITKLKGKVNHSACKWCYNDIPLEQFAEYAQDIGLKSVELLNPDEWKVMTDRGLTCAISNGSPLGITKGFNDTSLHEQLRADIMPLIPRAADQGIPQIICFSGNRNGMPDDKGLENCAIGLEPLIKEAEKYNIKIVMELLNSKVDHADYQCDHTEWGVALAEKLGSPNFGLLYDIYHMQIMEGDVIATIRKNQKYISHYHTGGVPGRNEINESQELNYKAIVQAIVETGYKGYIAQEFIPTRKDPLVSLREGVAICDA